MSCLIHVVVVASAKSEGINFTGICMELFHKLSFVRKGQLLNSYLLHKTKTLGCIMEWYVVCSDDNDSICIYNYV